MAELHAVLKARRADLAKCFKKLGVDGVEAGTQLTTSLEKLTTWLKGLIDRTDGRQHVVSPMHIGARVAMRPAADEAADADAIFPRTASLAE